MSEKEGRRSGLKDATGEEVQSLKHYLVKGEHIVYHARDIFFTNFRIIKYHRGFWAKALHFFYSSFEDLDFKHLESIQAKQVVNLKLVFWAFIIMLLGPISSILGAIPGFKGIANFLFTYVVQELQLGGLLLIGFVLIVSAIIIRDRVIEFRGSHTIIRSVDFYDEELTKIRELQRLAKKN